jgi:hypothetical protein
VRAAIVGFRGSACAPPKEMRSQKGHMGA